MNMSIDIRGDEVFNDQLILTDSSCDVIDVVIDDRDNDKGDNSDDDDYDHDNDEVDKAVLLMLAIQLSFHLKRHDKAKQQIDVLENKLHETRKRKRRAENNSYTSLEPMYKYRCSVLSNTLTMYNYYRQHHYDCAQNLAKDVLVQMEQNEGELSTGHIPIGNHSIDNQDLNQSLRQSQNHGYRIYPRQTQNHSLQPRSGGSFRDDQSMRDDDLGSSTDNFGSNTGNLGSGIDIHIDHMHTESHLNTTYRARKTIYSMHYANRNM